MSLPYWLKANQKRVKCESETKNIAAKENAVKCHYHNKQYLLGDKKKLAP